MFIKWKAFKTDGGGEFELPENSQLLHVNAINEGGNVLVVWVELTPAERIERMRATQSGRVIT